MFWILEAILFGELVSGGVFALILLLDWLLRFLKVHFQKTKEENK